MTPFRVDLRPGESPYRQIVFAATRAVVAGELAPGAPFPSVRDLSQRLKINPNTAHKAVAELVRTGLLEVHPGVGTVVAADWPVSAGDRRRLLRREVEELVVEAQRLGLGQEEVMGAIAERWEQLAGRSPARPRNAGARS